MVVILELSAEFSADESYRHISLSLSKRDELLCLL